MVNEARSAPYDSGDYLESATDVQEYLNAALEDGDERVLLRALRTVAEKRGGISRLAGETGLARKSLYRALSEDGNPRFSSLVAILRAMGLELALRSRRDVNSPCTAPAVGGGGDIVTVPISRSPPG